MNKNGRKRPLRMDSRGMVAGSPREKVKSLYRGKAFPANGAKSGWRRSKGCQSVPGIQLQPRGTYLRQSQNGKGEGPLRKLQPEGLEKSHVKFSFLDPPPLKEVTGT